MLTADVAQMSSEVRATTENVNKLVIKVDALVAKVDDLATGFGVLAQLARPHEERLDSLEGRKG